MAPAGSPEGFYGALHAGADAVYLGGSRFGARAYAENFTREELTACIRYARLFGVKVYLTVNTLFKEEELQELGAFLEPFYQAGLSGVIVQDLGTLRQVRQLYGDLPIHASTQMSVCTGAGAALLKEMGVSRIVPARELSLREVIAMKQETGLAIETFIHGAMCYCYSGQCLFSSVIGGRSGNRGRCAQPCRLPYQVKGKTFYPLSMKDLCTIERLPLLLEAGIDSFKIEGRMKKPEYAAGVTALYRKYIDRYEELRERLGAKGAKEAYRVETEDMERLHCLYVRGQTQEGYYFQKNGPQMIASDNPAYRAVEESLLADIRRRHLQNRRRLPVEIEAAFRTGAFACVTLRRGDAQGRAVGGLVQPARKNPVTEEDLEKQLKKLGDTPFEAVSLKTALSQDAFYPLKGVNELRRQAAKALEKSLLDGTENKPKQSTETTEKRPNQSIQNNQKEENAENKGESEEIAPPESMRKNRKGQVSCDQISQQTGWAVSVSTLEQLQALLRIYPGRGTLPVRLDRIYLDGDLVVLREKETASFREQIKRTGAEPFFAVPYVLRREDKAYLENLCRIAAERGVSGFLVRSLDSLGALREREAGFRLRADAGLFVLNSKAAEALWELTEGFCLPYELKASEQRMLLERVKERGPGRFEKILYSRIPMMVTANCVQKTAQGCKPGRDKTVSLKDRYGKIFPVRLNCLHCGNVIYNSLPFALPEGERKWRGLCDLRLDFTLETGEETGRVLKSFWQGEPLPGTAYTGGLEKRGVE